MASYRILIKASAIKELDAVGQKRDRQRIVQRIQQLVTDPRGHGSEKLSGQLNLYRVRVGRFRIVYSIQDDELLIHVVKIGHRKDVYR